tara:strand:+ start:28494 stop:28706 length:213 start_codon:yes stop_codon:yes gene_type:complete
MALRPRLKATQRQDLKVKSKKGLISKEEAKKKTAESPRKDISKTKVFSGKYLKRLKRNVYSRRDKSKHIS